MGRGFPNDISTFDVSNVSNRTYDNETEYNNTDHGLHDTIAQPVPCEAAHVLPLISLNIVLGILSILLNCLVLVFLNRKRRSYNAHCHLVSSLCTSYLIVGATWLVLWILTLTNQRRCNNGLCKCIDGFIILLHNVGVIGSMLHLVLMSIEHYIALFVPLKFKEIFTIQRVTVTLLVLWLTAAACSLSSFSQALYTHRTSQNVEFCDVFKSEGSDRILQYILLAILAVSMVILAYIYSRICFCKQSYQHSDNHNNSHVTGRAHRKLLKTTSLIWGSFVVCWTPFIILTLAASTHDLADLGCHFRVTLLYLSAMPVVNSLCGPVIYSCRSHGVVKYMARICGK